MGQTNFPGGISSMGVPVFGNGIPATHGKVFFVNYGTGSDGNNGLSTGKPFKTVSKAYSMATTNADDVIVLFGNSTHALTEMLTVSKNRVHFVGMDGTARMYGQNAKVSLGATTAATDIGTILNTGVRNSFSNIKFMNSNTVAEGIYCFVEGGEYTVLDNCEIYKENGLDETTASELVMNGDSCQIRNCVIGSLANAISGQRIRANVRMTKGIAGAGKVARDVVFEGCQFWKKAGHVDNRFFYGANADDCERMLLIRNCVFVSQKLSTAVPAQCVAFGAEQSAGYVLIDNCSSIGNTKLSTTTGVHITGAVPTYATSGIAVAS